MNKVSAPIPSQPGDAGRRCPSRLHLAIVILVLSLMVFKFLQYDTRGILVRDSVAVNHVEFRYGFPAEALFEWRDWYYQPPGTSLNAGKEVLGSRWSLGGLAIDLIFSALVVALGTILYRSLAMTFMKLVSHSAPRPPVLPDEKLDGEPTNPGWDEAKNG